MSNKDLLESLDQFSRVVNQHQRDWDNRILFSLTDNAPTGSLRLYFDAVNPGQGAAKDFMPVLLRLADDKQAKLDLIAMADDPSMQERLIAFYERNGFTRKGYQLLMTREPQQPNINL